jgi:hypothetical protein
VREFPHPGIWRDGNGSGEQIEMRLKIKVQAVMMDDQGNQIIPNRTKFEIDHTWLTIGSADIPIRDKWDAKSEFGQLNEYAWRQIEKMMRSV